MSKTARRIVMGVAAIASLATVACVSIPTTASASPSRTLSTPTFQETWEHNVDGSFWFGSPGVADLDGKGPSVIEGTTNGNVYAFHVSDGSTSDGNWPVNVGAAVYSTPATLGSGSSAKIFLGLGVSGDVFKGGFRALRANGTTLWSAAPYGGITAGAHKVGVMASLAVGPLQSSDDVIGGAMGQLQIEVNASTGKTNGGFPWLQADTNFSSPAIADLKGTGKNYIVEGGDSTAGRALYQFYSNGGHIRILSPRGHQGSVNLNDGLVCQYNTNQVVQSAPAVGPFLNRGGMGIVTGMGTFWPHASDTNKIIAIDTGCHRAWSYSLDSASWPSPALADLTGAGKLDVVTSSERGTVYAFDGATGKLLWKVLPGGKSQGSVTTFRSPIDGIQYVLVPTNDGVYVLNGATGATVAHLAQGVTDRNSATVTADPNGTVGITIGGGHTIVHYELVGSSVTTVQTKGSWPMYHHDPQLTGFTGGTSTGNVKTVPTKPCTSKGATANVNCIG